MELHVIVVTDFTTSAKAGLPISHQVQDSANIHMCIETAKVKMTKVK